MKKEKDWDLKRLSDDELEALPLTELQRIIDRRWAHGKKELEQRAIDELSRRNPKNNWQCLRCGKKNYHEKEIRVAGGFLESFLGWEQNKYHAIICNYCGKSEFYNVKMSGSQQIMGVLGN